MEPPPPRNVSERRSPSRPSFQAPTKASLARSHPEILERALSRSPTRNPARKDDQQTAADMRVFGLRDRKALRPSITLTQSPAGSLNHSQQSPLALSNRRSSGLAAFAAPPRRVSKRISASDLLFQSPTASQETRMQASMENTPEDQLASELGSATGDFSGDIEAPLLHDGFDEPDLPPTPTQLGLEPPPGRPRGLINSSPSIRHEKWAKRRPAGDLENSPSKLRTVDYGAGLEDLTEHVATMNDSLFPESVVKKRKVRRKLSADLESFKQDIVKLEGLCEKLQQQGEDIGPYMNDLSPLLILSGPSHANSANLHLNDNPVSSLISTLLPFGTMRPPKPRHPRLEPNPFALDHNTYTDSYLSGLAPLKITSTSNTISASKSGRLTERHQIVLSAPRPFPPNIYKISVSYETNLDMQSLVSLSAEVDEGPQDYLQQWVNKRLENRLLKLDVSGLCWGINRYWEALVSRGRIWAQIEDQHSYLIPSRNRSTHFGKSKKVGDLHLRNPGIITTSDMRRILPHLERTSMIFGSKEKSFETLLLCELTIDEWSGEPELVPTICISTSGFDSGSSEKVEREAKKLFETILSENAERQTGPAGGFDGEAIVKATACVLNVLFGKGGRRQEYAV